MTAPKSSDRAQLAQMLAKSLAHAKANHPEKAGQWAQRLVDKLRDLKLLKSK